MLPIARFIWCIAVARSQLSVNREAILVVTKVSKYLGHGLYTIAEAAMYARVPPRTLARWLFGGTDRKPAIDPQFGRDERVVSFLDLVQSRAIREISFQYHVPLAKFQQAIKVAKRKYGLDYPFARKHCTYYHLAIKELVIQPPGSDDFVEVSGTHQGQLLFQFTELYLQSLDFDADGLANNWRVYNDLVINPALRFGEPLLKCGYSARTIWESIRTEGGIDAAAQAYELSRDDVVSVYRFYVDYLGTAPA